MTESVADQPHRPVAVVTGGSRGLGLALTSTLAGRGWRVVIDARDAARLADAVAGLPEGAITAVPGDVADPAHRRALADAADAAGGARLLVNNASVLGPSPQPRLADYPLDELEHVYAVNTLAPLALAQLLLAAEFAHRVRWVRPSDHDHLCGWCCQPSASSMACTDRA
ncbi:MAG: SDR family NAD(P)-dependent oxidoreductase [Haloechinothrix sp.]